ncbi:MAG: histone-like nucleoid-structuring protein Lsr2, partial [Bowdeniella nasicola]|nr:histone-like nucleoid-structuring protein Lsr2 [Bowdeniella nasicola]
VAQKRQGTSDAATIRVWAMANGIAISDRGRIPAEIREAYLRATQMSSGE